LGHKVIEHNMAAAQNDELISVRRSELKECVQDLVNLKACFKMLVKERAKSILEEKAEKAEKEEKAAEHLLDGVNALKRKFETMVNGHDRVMLPDDEGPGLQTDSEESETDEEGPGLQTDSDDDGETLGRRMHSQLVRVGPHRVELWQSREERASDMERARQRLSERARMNGGPLREGAGGSGRGRPLP
jgi:hypothetical protein